MAMKPYKLSLVTVSPLATTDKQPRLNVEEIGQCTLPSEDVQLQNTIIMKDGRIFTIRAITMREGEYISSIAVQQTGTMPKEEKKSQLQKVV